jgi:prepilin-type N-terminal cleavage/methylation domain-containing protein
MIAHNLLTRGVFMKNQKGFTLVEMAIVLVIIGLLLGGVLKGQELIDNSRIKNAINDLKGISAANNGYFDRFHAQAGDDGPIATLQARSLTGAWATVNLAGNSDGLLTVTAAQTFNGGGENATFFQHTRAAGFLAGNHTLTAAAALPTNSFGGLIGVTGTAVTGMPINSKYVCMSRVPGKAARAIDTSMDNGTPNSGSVWATLAVAGANTVPGAAAATYVDESFYTICTSM